MLYLASVLYHLEGKVPSWIDELYLHNLITLAPYPTNRCMHNINHAQRFPKREASVPTRIASPRKQLLREWGTRIRHLPSYDRDPRLWTTPWRRPCCVGLRSSLGPAFRDFGRLDSSTSVECRRASQLRLLPRRYRHLAKYKQSTFLQVLR